MCGACTSITRVERPYSSYLQVRVPREHGISQCVVLLTTSTVTSAHDLNRGRRGGVPVFSKSGTGRGERPRFRVCQWQVGDGDGDGARLCTRSPSTPRFQYLGRPVPGRDRPRPRTNRRGQGQGRGPGCQCPTVSAPGPDSESEWRASRVGAPGVPCHSEGL
jgi:hypothetical protein